MPAPSKLLAVFVCAIALAVTGGAVVAADSGDGPPVLWDPADSVERPSVIVDTDNSTNYLSPDADNVSREEYQTGHLDVAAAVNGDALRLKGEHQKGVLGERLDASADDAVALELVESLEEEIAALDQQHRQLYAAYSDGQINTRSLYQELVRLGVAGDQYRDIVNTLNEEGSVPEELAGRYASLGAETPLLPSSFASEIENDVRTNGQAPIYVQSGEDSLVLATVENGTYHRQAALLGETDRNLTDQFGTGEQDGAEDAFVRAEQLYPWALANAERANSRQLEGTSVYRAEVNHPHGALETYLDGGTTNPFYERQEKNVFAVPVEFAQTFNDGLRLDIELTSPTGPMLVEVTETQRLDHENITVSVDGNTVRTLSQGDSFYTVQPRDSFEITAETDTGAEVSLFLTP